MAIQRTLFLNCATKSPHSIHIMLAPFSKKKKPYSKLCFMCLYIHKLSYDKMYLLVHTLKPLVCMHKKHILQRFGLYTRGVLRIVFSAWRLLADLLYSTNGRFFPMPFFFRLTLFSMRRNMLVEGNLPFISYSHIYIYIYINMCVYTTLA